MNNSLLQHITCCFSAGALLIFFALGTVFQNLTDRFQSATGYEVFAEKRKDFAAHLRGLPMGYFTAGNLGRIIINRTRKSILLPGSPEM